MKQTKTGKLGLKIVSGGTVVRIPRSKNTGAVNKPASGNTGGRMHCPNDPRCA